ncbi:hypothetical protein KY339_02445 [Candidatus Woesearchaeota archaeon]|nr:hypothetical protein [Candidatus Woesearchaeota archaeon]
MPYTKSNICQIDEAQLSCMGCCGHNFKSKNELMEDLKKNTVEYTNCRDLGEFIDRPRDLRLSGVCRNLILVKNRILCPLHPAVNGGIEYREGVCDVWFVCKTAFVFDTWPRKKQMEFVEFLKKKNLDWYDYSLGMINSTLLDEFEGKL